ncbi:hypothetical protein [Bradyrhizobium sp. LHD-71]|uniref:hypothetical protein n=1 Tax=Bradyrhizobium sp. LHD-71 TaxID=3072141 RepID=UPI00280D79D6|nr:hypothetical protein [Bradyrhizobium sp. LHD-71]MDQ8729423.1 hypothetical protein [Bradyrhizobium sp. LHD-71]
MPSGRNNDPIRSLRPQWEKLRGAVSGPQAGFLGATIIALATWSVSQAMLPPDMVMPLVATLFLVLAAGIGTVAWRRRRVEGTQVASAQVTYADVAGALTLIGFFVAATIDPDQLVRLVESRGDH